MGEVIILPELADKLAALVGILSEKGYFFTEENAITYVDAIIDFIHTIPNQQHYQTQNKKYGRYYCKYKANKKTTWYITFDNEGTTYVIKNLMNNHTEEYPTYIKGARQT